MRPSITGVLTPAARPRPDMATSPHGTSSTTYLCCSEGGVGVHWYGPVGSCVSRWKVSCRESPPSP